MATTTEFVKSREVREVTVTLTYADVTSALMFRLPNGARIIDWVINVGVAFAGGTAELDAGTINDGDYYVDGASLAAVGRAAIGTALIQPGAVVTAVAPIYMNVGAGNTAGEVDVTCLFSMETDKRF